MKNKKTVNSNSVYTASSGILRISPSKVRRVLDQLKGRPYNEAVLLLAFMPYKACVPILKVLSLAATNASNQEGWKKSQLYVDLAWVNKKPTMKRFQPRAQGRGFPILKRSCEITLGVSLKG
uniref:Large ribosomal subunit protein uL22c n=1 Tax=Prasinococcus sp. CCMP1194 TaxID=110672 RepID=A0A088CJY3_9VIRI|nr:ribosomal protein L22 [Prasinococcus sp. CCMP1194]